MICSQYEIPIQIKYLLLTDGAAFLILHPNLSDFIP
jgi:hypothetical protein